MGGILSKKERSEISALIADILKYAGSGDRASVPEKKLSFYDPYDSFFVFEDEIKLGIRKINELKPNSITKFSWKEEDDPFREGRRIITHANFVINNQQLREIQADLNSNDLEAQPDRVVYFHRDTLYYEGRRHPMHHQTLNFIFMKALYQLNPDGGKFKNITIINKMRKLGAEKLSRHGKLELKDMQNTADRVERAFPLPKKSKIYETIRGYGIQFTN